VKTPIHHPASSFIRNQWTGSAGSDLLARFAGLAEGPEPDQRMPPEDIHCRDEGDDRRLQHRIWKRLDAPGTRTLRSVKSAPADRKNETWNMASLNSFRSSAAAADVSSASCFPDIVPAFFGSVVAAAAAPGFRSSEAWDSGMGFFPVVDTGSARLLGLSPR